LTKLNLINIMKYAVKVLQGRYTDIFEDDKEISNINDQLLEDET
jgi:hypothetical protein